MAKKFDPIKELKKKQVKQIKKIREEADNKIKELKGEDKFSKEFKKEYANAIDELRLLAKKGDSKAKSDFVDKVFEYCDSYDKFYHLIPDKDVELAKKYLQELSTSNDPFINLSLGNIYGHYCKDEKKAFEYYKKTYDLDNVVGGLDLGICYMYGFGCKKNLNKAIECLEKSYDEYAKVLIRRIKRELNSKKKKK